MIIAIPKEVRNDENRVAATPDICKKLVDMGMVVNVENDAGLKSGFTDEQYIAAGANIVTNKTTLISTAEMIFKIWAPGEEEISNIKSGTVVIANFHYIYDKAMMQKIADKNVYCFALNLIPRISRAQDMDILSSQSNLAGYKAVIDAVNMMNKAVPLMMTAAGTIPPARFLILGAGVAGLQAIATAKRLGAIVYASDVRPQVKEQVESLGGRFVEVKSDASLETAGGYAKETSEEYKKKQNEAIREVLANTDVVITTALIPGKKAPVLITKDMLSIMPANSIAIDLAAENGGNVEGAVEGKIKTINNVRVVGNSNIVSCIAQSASLLFAKNIFNFVKLMVDKETKKINLDVDDEIIRETCICCKGVLNKNELYGVKK